LKYIYNNNNLQLIGDTLSESDIEIKEFTISI